MDTPRFCHYLHTDTFGGISKEKTRGKEGAHTKVIGKAPEQRWRRGDGEIRSKEPPPEKIKQIKQNGERGESTGLTSKRG